MEIQTSSHHQIDKHHLSLREEEVAKKKERSLSETMEKTETADLLMAIPNNKINI